MFSLFGVAVLTAGGAVAASAVVAQRSLPANNHFYAFDGTGGAPVPNIVDMNVSTGVGTIVGNPTPPTHNAQPYSGTFDPTTQLGYWVATMSNPSVTGGLTTYLMQADLTTGISTDLGAMQGVGGWPTPPVTALAIDTGGHAYAIAFESGNYLYSLDLTTRQLTNRKAVQFPASNSKCLWAFAFNPKDNNFYINCEDRYFYKLDVATGVATLACTEPVGYWGSDGIAFDTNGIGWMDYGMPPNPQVIGILSFDVTQADCAVSSPSIARTVSGITNFDSQAMALSYPLPAPNPTPSPSPTPSASEAALAVTGVSLGNGVVEGVAAGLALILGVALVVWGVRRR